MSRGKKRHEQERRARIRRRQEEQRKASQVAGQEPTEQLLSAQAEQSIAVLDAGTGSEQQIGIFEPDPYKPGPRKADLRLAARAVKEEWDIPEAIRPSFVPEAALVYFDRNIDVEKRMTAGRIILAANGQNLKAKELQKPVASVNQLNQQTNIILRAEDLSDDELARIAAGGGGGGAAETPAGSPES